MKFSMFGGQDKKNESLIKKNNQESMDDESFSLSAESAAMASSCNQSNDSDDLE